MTARASRTFIDRYGPWAVVTGATLGIGRAFAEQLANRGLNLVLVGRNRDALERVAANLRDRFGIDALALAADLARPVSHQTLLRNTEHRDVGLLVAAAGFGTSGAFLTIDEAAEVQMFEVNCVAVMRQCRDFGRRFAGRGRGGIVLMGSLLGFQGVPRSTNYAATKAYVQTLAEGLRDEVKALGVDVISSAPGPVRSGFEARANMRMKFAMDPETVAVTTLASLGKRTTVVPGGFSKLLTYSLAPLHRTVRTRILGSIMAGMTNHHA